MPPSLVEILVVFSALSGLIPGFSSSLVVPLGKGRLALQRGSLMSLVEPAGGWSSFLKVSWGSLRVMRLRRWLGLVLVSQSSARGLFLRDLDKRRFGRFLLTEGSS